MAQNSYPNITINSTTTTLTDYHNGAIITSSYAGATQVVVTNSLAAAFKCRVVQFGAGTVAVVVGAGASVDGLGGATGTSGQFAVLEIIGVQDGIFVITGAIA